MGNEPKERHMTVPATEEERVRSLVEDWARAVRNRDLDGILAHHADDVVMFDVPPPLRSDGLDAYRATWDTFFRWARDAGVFDIEDLRVVAGERVAVCFASMRCAGYGSNDEREELAFRLTVGLEKQEGEWTVVHEHHSVPAP